MWMVNSMENTILENSFDLIGLNGIDPFNVSKVHINDNELSIQYLVSCDDDLNMFRLNTVEAELRLYNGNADVVQRMILKNIQYQDSYLSLDSTSNAPLLMHIIYSVESTKFAKGT